MLVLPALLRRSGGRAGALRLVAAAAGIVLVGYVPHVLAVGFNVLGYLPGYLHEENYGTGNRFLLLGALGIPGTAAQAVAVLLVGGTILAVAWASWRERITPAGGVLAVFGGAFLVATPSEPWYALILLCMAVLTGRLEWLGVVAAAYPLYVGYIIRGHPIGSGQLSYGLAALLALGITAVRYLQQRGQLQKNPVVDEPLTGAARKNR